jgi:hypothetical protein
MELTPYQSGAIERALDSLAQSKATDTSDESACFRMWGTMEVEVKILLGIIAELTGGEQ